MTIDTSTLLAILLDEPERVEFVSLIESAPRRVISAVSVLEAGMVLGTRKGPDGEVDLDGFLRRGEIEVIPFDLDQANEARRAFRRFGEGRHPAGLNFGDCASYALACWFREPLLFKGRDFGLTDVGCVREPPPAKGAQ